MPKNPCRVIIRTRPTATFAQDQIQIDQDKNTIAISQRSHAGDGPSNRQEHWRFRFHQVLHNAGQETVYDSLTRDVVAGAIDGVNGTVMAYGQTGAGKTFTMIGDTRNYLHRGVAPRAIAHVFQEVQQRVETEFTIEVSFLEIYNERIYDLLDETPNSQQTADFAVVDDRGGRGTTVRGLTRVPVTEEREALDQLFRGELQRTTAEHKLNKASNRSHCIFTVYIAQRSRMGASERVLTSKLNLVDLAGSERLKKTMSDSPLDDTIKRESMYINQSLTYLEQCVVALAKKSHAHVPYRQSKLTNVLKDSLGGNCNTLMFACVWGEGRHLEETISTLKLAARMMRVQNETALNESTDPRLLLKKYERQVKELKQELMMHDALAERSGIVYDAYTPEQRHELAQAVRAFVDAAPEDEDDIIPVNSVRQIREVFRQFKVIVRNAESLGGGGGAAGAAGGRGATRGSVSGALDGAGGEPSAAAEGAGAEGAEGAEGDGGPQLVGDAEDTGSFGIGVAADVARPNAIDRGRSVEDLGLDGADSPMAGSPAHASPMGGGGGFTADLAAEPSVAAGAPVPLNRDQAFEVFKGSAEGAEPHAALQSGRARMRQLRARAKQVTASVNAYKREIDELGALIAEKRAIREREEQEQALALGGGGGQDDAEDIVDEEEFRLMRQERDSKRAYRAGFDELRSLKMDLQAAEREVAGLKRDLLAAFDGWHAAGGAADAADGGEQPDDDEDKLDDGEQFDKLELERVVRQDPDSLAFFQAQKKMRATQNSMGAKHRQAQKTKRRM